MNADAAPSSRLRWIATVLGLYAVAGGCISFLGWALNVPALTDWFATGISIQPNTTVAAACAGAALVCLVWNFRRTSAGLGILVAAIGLMSLLENLTGINFGLDTILMFGRPWGGIAVVAPGLMGFPASTSWSLLGLALILAWLGSRLRQTAVILELITLALATLSFVGYLYHANPLYSLPRYTAIALQTSSMIISVALGFVISMSDQQPMRTLQARSAAGLLLRRALPFVILAPIVLGVLRTNAEDLGWVDAGMGRALLILSFILIMVVGVWMVAGELTRHESALMLAEDRLAQAAKMESLGRLAGGLAHDFNNQLQAVSGFANMIAKDAGLGEQSRQDLEQIQQSGEKIASLIRQLLAYGRQQVLAPESVELRAAVVDSLPFLRQFVGPTIGLVTETATDAVWVKVDRAQLHQILMNLTINARDAMPAGGTLTISVNQLNGISEGETDAGPREGDFGCLEVIDTGQGIDAVDLPYIFDPFFTTKGVGQGTGLGLATVHGIVSQSSGLIKVHSKAGQGSRFRILLPLTTPPLPEVVPEKFPALQEQRPLRILVVDDEPMIRSLLKRALEAEGYQVGVAADGSDALLQLKLPGRFDVVVSDVVMPRMGGAEMGQRLATEYPHLPVIWMSGYPQDTAFRKGRGRENEPFLQKPIKVNDLLQAISDSAPRPIGDHVSQRSGSL